jgi:hypothetical protein
MGNRRPLIRPRGEDSSCRPTPPGCIGNVGDQLQCLISQPFLVEKALGAGQLRDRPAVDGFAPDDVCVVLDIGRTRHAVHQRGDVGWAANVFQPARAVEFLLNRDEVGAHAAVEKTGDRLVDVTVFQAEEVSRAQPFTDERQAAVLDKQRAEHRSLGFDVVWGYRLGQGGPAFVPVHGEEGIAVAGAADIWVSSMGSNTCDSSSMPRRLAIRRIFS